MKNTHPQRVIASVCLAAALVGCAGRNRDVTIVRSLRVEGNKAVSEGAIKNRILTGEPKFYPLAKKRPFDPVAWDTDLQRIDRYYESQGFFQAEVKGQIEHPAPRAVDLTVTVTEGSPTYVDAITVRGLDQLPPEQRALVLEDLPLAPKTRFQEARWQGTKDVIRSRLRDLGYAEVVVRGEALVDVETRTAKVTVDAAPGTRYRFGDIQVTQGPTPAVNPTWISDEVAIALGRDSYFSDERMQEAQRRVFSMGVFSVARVTTGKPDPRSARLPVIVEVQEAPFRTLRLGGGVAFDQIRNEVRLLGDWTHRNFMGGLRQLKLRAEAGYAFLPNAYSVFRDVKADVPSSGPIYLVGADLEQPRLFNYSAWRGLVGVESDRQLEQAFTAISVRGRIGAVYRPWVDLSLSPMYRIEASRLDAPAFVSATVAPQTLGCPENPCVVLLSFLEQVATLDRRDDALNPNDGYYLSLSLQEGGGPLGGDFDYLRVMGDARYFLSPGFFERFTLAVRAQAGAMYPRSGRPGDTPIMQRFYAGGASSMRGFNARRLSPLLIVPASGRPDDPNRVALPIGGNGLLLGSAETRYRLTDALTLAVFLDAGNVTRERPTVDDVAGLMYAVGLGFRYQTPVGPLRIDFARRLPFGDRPVALRDGQPIDYVENDSCFGLGGSGRSTFVKDSFCVLHISLGEAF